MDLSSLGAFALFVIVMTGTPGPGNLTFMAIGSSRGYGAALPLILASQIGNIALCVAVSLGLGIVFSEDGTAAFVFKCVCMTYMLYLAWRIINLNLKPKTASRLPSFIEGVLIHPLSPKTWGMVVLAFGSYFAGNGLPTLLNTLILTSGFIMGGLVFHSLWALVGQSLLKILGQGMVLRSVSIVMAVLMVAVTAWSLFV